MRNFETKKNFVQSLEETSLLTRDIVLRLFALKSSQNIEARINQNVKESLPFSSHFLCLDDQQVVHIVGTFREQCTKNQRTIQFSLFPQKTQPFNPNFSPQFLQSTGENCVFFHHPV